VISFVCWKWRVAGTARVFSSEHVNLLRAMIARHYKKSFRLICITDKSDGLDAKIEAMKIPEAAHQAAAQIENPRGARFPNCYSRLWNFSREAIILGERICQIDIDLIILSDLVPLLDRAEDFVGWSDRRFEKNKVAGGIYLLRTGSIPWIWEEFSPAYSPSRAFRAGFLGSDQGWISYCLANRSDPKPSIGLWRSAELLKINWTPPFSTHAPPARIVFTNGVKPPWNSATQRKYPWIKKHLHL
jgi:hypothetical protein